ncbi:MAG: T9SS type A sorting domain-containing protein [bacterium]|nr:T9SS type A sorting domain-containing protein [bacterium]
MMRVWIGSWLVALCLINSSFASPGNRGYSGAPGALGRCASSCHGAGTGTVQVTGFPTNYVPDSTYLITIQAVTGFPIKNFNASVRIGTGTNRAGTITAGQGTSTYNVAQETNGVHLSTLDLQTATFNWQAPAVGAGTVRLYVAAHQGARNTGPNTNITLVANEAVIPQPPAPCSSPLPTNGEADQPLNLTLRWATAARATAYEVFIGTAEPLPSISNVVDTSFALSALEPSTTYLWRIDAINDVGITAGPVWSFTTEAQSPARDIVAPGEFALGQAYPNPFNGLVRLPLNVPANLPVRAHIYDRTGRLVVTLLDNQPLGQTAELEWNAAGQAAGLYFLRCLCAGQSVTQKLIYLP